MPSHNHEQHVSAAIGGEGVRTDYNSDAACGAFPQGIGTGARGGSGSHNHSLTTSTSNTGSKGSNTSFSTLNPYYTVYIWTRTN